MTGPQKHTIQTPKLGRYDWKTRETHEPRKKKKRPYFHIESWLFNRDPYKWFVK